MNAENFQIGDRVKNARNSKGLTQSQLAEIVFISESYMNLIEANKRNPSMDVLTKLAESLDISIDYLIFGTAVKSEQSLYNEWKKLVEGRSSEEIDGIINVTKTFFSCLDKLTDDLN